MPIASSLESPIVVSNQLLNLFHVALAFLLFDFGHVPVLSAEAGHPQDEEALAVAVPQFKCPVVRVSDEAGLLKVNADDLDDLLIVGSPDLN